MADLDSLLACAGHWQGISRLQDPLSKVADGSTSTLAVVPLLGGRFVRVDYTWAYHGTPQEGSFLFGSEAADFVIAYWIDSWHMGDKVMVCRGAADQNGAISVLGSYSAPTGPDWGWRTTIGLKENDTIALEMFNITPDGTEEIAVTASYIRV